MSYDELELDKLGDEKSALFFLISDTDTTYNFLVALAFSQMFNLLCERADNTYGGRLPYHVRVLWDEAANTGQVPGLEKIVAVIRSREISLTLFYQAMSQCKALYKDHSETIMGNMDSIVFLGGREASTLKDISENWLGKATISMQTEGRSRGQSESYSQNMQRLGRELMTTSPQQGNRTHGAELFPLPLCGGLSRSVDLGLCCHLCGADPEYRHRRRPHRGDLGMRGIYGVAVFYLIQNRQSCVTFVVYACGKSIKKHLPPQRGKEKNR